MAHHKKIPVEKAVSRAGYDSVEEIMKANLYDSTTGVPSCCTCDFIVEPDGECPHGNPSVLREKGLV